jgi:hexosaminidase
MFVPSLSWQNRRFYIEMAQKCRFSQDFILKSHRIAASLNRTAIGWHEIWRHLGTRLPKTTIIHFWLGGGDGLFDMLDATENGYRAVWSIARGVGFGSWYTGGDAEPWETMYIREPCEGLSEAQCSNVLGGGAEQWGETVDTSDLEQTLWPRAAAVAERLWSPRPSNASATGPAPAWCIRNSPHGQPKGDSPYFCVNNTAAPSPVRARLEAFRCYLNRRGVLAAPVENKIGRSAPPGPGGCESQ